LSTRDLILRVILRTRNSPGSSAALVAQLSDDARDLISRNSCVRETLYQDQRLLNRRVEGSSGLGYGGRSSRIGVGWITGVVLSTICRLEMLCIGGPKAGHIYRRCDRWDGQALVQGCNLLSRIILRIWHCVQAILIVNSLGRRGSRRGVLLLSSHVGQRCQDRGGVGCAGSSSGLLAACVVVEGRRASWRSGGLRNYTESSVVRIMHTKASMCWRGGGVGDLTLCCWSAQLLLEGVEHGEGEGLALLPNINELPDFLLQGKKEK
jgi:hypothetical protein